MSATSAAASVSVVLIHGGFVDGSGWQGVYSILRPRGYRVSIVQNPTLSLDDDVAVTKRVIAAQPGAVILVGHSYGGVVVTQAGNEPKVAGLVYIAAFAPDKGESVATLIANPPPGAPVPPILPPQDGFPHAGQREIRRIVRGRRSKGPSGVHGEFPGSLGRPGTRGNRQRGGLEIEAELVSGGDR